MKKNFKFFAFSVLALSLGLMSCKKNEDVKPNVEGEKTIVSFKLTQSAPRTYAAPSGVETATADETGITGVAQVYIFNGDGSYKGVVEAAPAVPLTQHEIQLSTGVNYFFYPVANVPVAPAFTLVTTNRVDFEKSLIELGSMADITTASKFLMTAVSVEPQKVTTVGTSADPVRIKLQIGRACAKVNLEFDPATVNQPAFGALTEVKYKIVNQPTTMHFQAHKVGGAIQSAHWLYAPATPATTDFFANAYGAAATPAAPDTYQYAVENTQDVPKRGYTTAALMTGKFVPAKLHDINNNGNEGAAADGNGTFSYVKYADGTKSAIYPGVLDDTKIAVIAGFETKATTTAVNPGDPADKMVVHTNGESFYWIWLGDKSEETATLKYRALRNNVYWINVTHVVDAGHETDVMPNPELPIEADTSVICEIENAPWTLVEQNEAAGAI